MKQERVNEAYRQHKLTAAFYGGRYQGRVRKNKEELLATDGESIEDVLVELRKFVDQRNDELSVARGQTREVFEYVEALREIRESLSDSHLAMLKAHYRAPCRELTATQLADAAGYRNYSAANLQYGMVGKMLQEQMLIDLPRREDGSRIYTCALATATEDQVPEEQWVWRLKPEVAAAIEELGLAT